MTWPPVPPSRSPHGAEALAEAEARAKAIERRAAAVLAEAEETAAQKEAEAAERAHAMLEEAEAAAEQIRAEARQQGLMEGREEGFQAGMAQAEGQAGALVAEAGQAADSLLAEAQSGAISIREGALAERERLLDSSREQVIDLAFAIARQILRTELTLKPAAILPMLEAALVKLKGEEEPQIRVSPAVAALLEEQRSRLLAALPGARRIQLDADPGLGDGDFLIQGSQGFVDGRLERQLEVLESDVKEEER